MLISLLQCIHMLAVNLLAVTYTKSLCLAQNTGWDINKSGSQQLEQAAWQVKFTMTNLLTFFFNNYKWPCDLMSWMHKAAFVWTLNISLWKAVNKSIRTHQLVMYTKHSWQFTQVHNLPNLLELSILSVKLLFFVVLIEKKTKDQFWSAEITVAGKCNHNISYICVSLACVTALSVTAAYGKLKQKLAYNKSQSHSLYIVYQMVKFSPHYSVLSKSQV